MCWDVPAGLVALWKVPSTDIVSVESGVEKQRSGILRSEVEFRVDESMCSDVPAGLVAPWKVTSTDIGSVDSGVE